MTPTLTQQILEAVKQHPAVVTAWRQNSGKFKSFDGRRIIHGSPKGTPDIIGMLVDGRFLAIEVKTGKDRLSPEQTEFLSAVKRFGGVAGTVRTVEAVIKLLDAERPGFFLE